MALTEGTRRVSGILRASENATSVGGWEASEMRELLNDSLYLALSDDVRSAIVSVDKLSNNVGSSSSTNCVSTTHDRLWLPSIVELCGPVNWEYFTNPAGADLYNQVFNGEGSQYAYFASCDIDDAGPNAVLALGDQWWLRSSAASTGRGRFVGEGGDPSEFGDSNVVRGVVFGFCV